MLYGERIGTAHSPLGSGIVIPPVIILGGSALVFTSITFAAGVAKSKHARLLGTGMLLYLLLTLAIEANVFAPTQGPNHALKADAYYHSISGVPKFIKGIHGAHPIPVPPRKSAAIS